MVQIGLFTKILQKVLIKGLKLGLRGGLKRWAPGGSERKNQVVVGLKAVHPEGQDDPDQLQQEVQDQQVQGQGQMGPLAGRAVAGVFEPAVFRMGQSCEQGKQDKRKEEYPNQPALGGRKDVLHPHAMVHGAWNTRTVESFGFRSFPSDSAGGQQTDLRLCWGEWCFNSKLGKPNSIMGFGGLSRAARLRSTAWLFVLFLRWHGICHRLTFGVGVCGQDGAGFLPRLKGGSWKRRDSVPGVVVI